MKEIFGTRQVLTIGGRDYPWIPVVRIPFGKVRKHYFPEQTDRLRLLRTEIAGYLATPTGAQHVCVAPGRSRPGKTMTLSANSFELETACLGYLLQWSTLEKEIFDGLRSPSHDERLRALNRAAAFFRIARNLPIKREQGAERLSPVLEMFDQLPENPPDDVMAAVIEFQDRLSAIYGRRALSFSSKVLWLRYRAPIVIYDAQARRALLMSRLSTTAPI